MSSTTAGRVLAACLVVASVALASACDTSKSSEAPAPSGATSTGPSASAATLVVPASGRAEPPPELKRVHARLKASNADDPCVSVTALQRGGDPVMHGPVPVYFIFSGDAWSASRRQLLQQFIGDLSGSPPFLVNTTYADGQGAVDGTLHIAGVTDDRSASAGKSTLNDDDITAILNAAIGSGGFAADESAIYAIFLSQGYSGGQGAMCDGLCGYNDHAGIHGKNVKYTVVPDPGRCPQWCYVQSVSDSAGGVRQVGPNGDAATDAAIDTLFHEVSELVTDPNGNSWGTVVQGQRCQTADICHVSWGAESTVPPGDPRSAGAQYNFSRNGHNYQIQQLFVNQDGEGHGSCVSSTNEIYTNTPDFTAGLGGASEDRIVGANPCRPGYFRLGFDIHMASGSSGHCDTPTWMSDELTDCRAQFHLGVPAVQHLHCVAHVTGATTEMCPAGLTVCASRCVDLSGDTANCGACGNACPAGFSCTQGGCTCPAGDTNCSGHCVNLSSDSGDCGACGRACPAGTICSRGTCSTPSGPCHAPSVLCCYSNGEPICGPPAMCSHTPACKPHLQ